MDLIAFNLVNNLIFVFNIILSTLFGLMLGFEREKRGKRAGLRTFSLICLGSTVFTMLSVYSFGASEPARIASTVVAGIGFIGAGVIWKGGGDQTVVHGITTATDIWVSAAIGMAVGVGQYIMAFATFIMLMLVLNMHSRTDKE